VFTALRCAKWHLAVLGELAEPGRMTLAPVTDAVHRVVDFEWIAATPMASHLLGCAGTDLVGRRLLTMLAGHPGTPRLLRVYRDALGQSQGSTVAFPRVGAAQDDDVVCHAITPGEYSISVVLTDPRATARVDQFKTDLAALVAKYPVPEHAADGATACAPACTA